MHRFAVIADPHYFDIFPGYPVIGPRVGERKGASIHTLRDSAASTRLFNEGYFALPAALDLCVHHQIRHVVIAGDLTDDGQVSAMDGAIAVLDDYEARHGLRCFLTPGNHDAYGMSGRDITRRLLNDDGSYTVVGSASPDMAGLEQPYLQEPRQRCQAYPALLEQWGRFGLARRPTDLHWETPFGPDDAAETRFCSMTAPDGKTRQRQLDLSYQVEPEPGLWLLSIDANIFVPRDGRPDNSQPDAFEDSTAAGWSALIRHKPFLVEWMRDVARRADMMGKTLVCFSHYPMVDPLDGTTALEAALLGQTMSVRRTPSSAVSEALCATGIHTHFSGHMHIYDRACVTAGGNTLTNYAMPSLIAFPAVIGLVSARGKQVEIGFERLEFDSYRDLLPGYQAELNRLGASSPMLAASSYGDYLFQHIGEQVRTRLMTDEWPPELSTFVEGHDVQGLLALLTPHGADIPGLLREASLAALPLSQVMTDMHALRMGSEMAFDFIPARRLEAYRALAAFVVGTPRPPAGIAAQMHDLISMLERFAKAGHSIRWCDTSRQAERA